MYEEISFTADKRTTNRNSKTNNKWTNKDCPIPSHIPDYFI